MTEFLTENVRRAYPLAYEMPAGVDPRWGRLLVDASVSCDWQLSDGDTVRLLLVHVGADRTVSLRVGTANDDDHSVRFVLGSVSGDFGTVFVRGTHVAAFLTVSAVALAEIQVSTMRGTTVVDVPFAARCVSSAIPRVEEIQVYAAPPCTRPIYQDVHPDPVLVLRGGDVVLAAGDGIDLETTVSDPAAGEILRVSALAAEEDASGGDVPIDMMIRGDDCMEVETLPDVVVGPGGAPVPAPAEEKGKHGVIRIGQRCKPCCQCDDYKDAVDRLRPGEAATGDVERRLNTAKAEYDAAMVLFEEVKDMALDAINSPVNVHGSATAVASGGVYTGSSSGGSRCRIAVNLLIINRTLVTAAVSEVDLVVDGYGASPVRVSWNTAGSNPRGGSSFDGVSWSLAPGDTLSLVATYSRPGTTNTAVKPSGMSASFVVTLPGKDPYHRTLEVK